MVEKIESEKTRKDQPYETDVSDFIKNTWQHIVYESYYSDSFYSELFQKALVRLIEDEENWKGQVE
jgi:hypothetical protein